MSFFQDRAVFKKIRRNRHALRLANHIQRIDTSIAMRERYQSEGRKGMVLAINYELASDAMRALDALRRVEELTTALSEGGDRGDLEAVRRRLFDLTSLPALPLSRVRGDSSLSSRASQAEIEALYAQFIQATASGEQH